MNNSLLKTATIILLIGILSVSPLYCTDVTADTTEGGIDNNWLNGKVYSPIKTVYLVKGKSMKIPAIGRYTKGSKAKLEYYSNNKKIATVTESGKVTAKKQGATKLYIKAVSCKRVVIKVKVVNKIKKVKKFTVKGLI